jgi:hypothetical protein
MATIGIELGLQIVQTLQRLYSNGLRVRTIPAMGYRGSEIAYFMTTSRPHSKQLR